MPIFRYHALNSANDRVVGHVAADMVAQAVAQLEAQGLIVQSIAVAPEDELLEVGPTIVPEPPLSETAPQPPDELAERALLEEHLAGVLKQTPPLVPALRAYAAEMPKDRRQRELQEVCEILATGNAAEAVRDFARLPEYWIPLLSAAGSSHDPGRILREFLEQSRQSDQLAREWRRSLIYPIIVICFAAAIMVGFAFTIIPMFKSMFEDFDLELNSFTAFNIALAEAITDGTALVALGFAAIVCGIVYAFRRQLPLALTSWVGDLFGGAASRVQFTHFAADLLDAGIDVPRAVRIASSASRRPSVRRAGWQLAYALETGAAGLPRSDARTLTVSAIHALRTPIPTPARVRLLKELSLCHAERARRRFTWTRGFFEPIALTCVALAVGNVMLSMFVPLIDLIKNLSG